MAHFKYRAALLLFAACLSITFSNAQKEQMTSTFPETLQTAQTGYAPVNGLKLYYEIYGSGQPLVLGHVQ